MPKLFEDWETDFELWLNKVGYSSDPQEVNEARREGFLAAKSHELSFLWAVVMAAGGNVELDTDLLDKARSEDGLEISPLMIGSVMSISASYRAGR